jgi:hypothetical protein
MNPKDPQTAFLELAARILVEMALGSHIQPHRQRQPSESLNDKFNHIIYKMVCAKCQKLSKTTTLATPGVKKKNDMYYGSPAGSSKSGDKSKTSATLGNNGIGKVSSHAVPFVVKC